MHPSPRRHQIPSGQLLNSLTGTALVRTMADRTLAVKEGHPKQAPHQLPHCAMALIHEHFHAERHQPLFHRGEYWSNAAAELEVRLQRRNLCAWLPAATAVPPAAKKV